MAIPLTLLPFFYLTNVNIPKFFGWELWRLAQISLHRRHDDLKLE